MIPIDTRVEEHRLLINRVCADPRVASKPRAVSDLRLLCDHSLDTAESRKKFLGSNPADRISDVIQILGEYFDTHPGEPKRMFVQQAEGKRNRSDLYCISLVDNIISLTATRLFWNPYSGKRLVIVYGKPLFVASRSHNDGPYTTFVRDVEINVGADLKKRLPKNSIVNHLQERSEEYAFVTAGEVEAIFAFTKVFTPRPWALDMEIHGLEREATLDRYGPATANRDANVVVIGTTRTNGFMVGYQDSFPNDKFAFVLGERGICDRNGRILYEEHTDPNNSRIRIAYTLVTRLRGIKDDHSTVTLIASHSGRAVQRVVETLTNDGELENVVKTGLPDEFQVVFEVKILAKGAESGPWRVVNKWPLDQANINVAQPIKKR